MKSLTQKVLTGLVAAAAVLATTGVVAPTPTPSAASSPPLSSPFYSYTGKTPLRALKPGTVLKTRVVPYSVQGIATPVSAVQVLYRTKNALGRPALNVTTVLRPPLSTGPVKVASYQSFYDSLNPADEPSAAIAGGAGLGDGIANAETGIVAPLLLAGVTINIPDTEGQGADFAAVPEYGITTIDSLRAISHDPAADVGADAPIGLLGYSGGAIGTGWAAELAPRYAPAIAKRMVGATMGGVVVDPDHILHYIDGSTVWSPIMAMALVGLARGYHVDLTRYMSRFGKKLTRSLQRASISTVLGSHPGMTFKQLTKPRYAKPESIPILVKIANKLIMGRFGTPAAPMQIVQGTSGYIEGTAGDKKGIGAGDGVTIAGDVRTLAREYCRRGVRVDYRQYPLSHIGVVAPWIAGAVPWLLTRFTGAKAPSTCGSIAKGNPVRPVRVAKHHH